MDRKAELRKLLGSCFNGDELRRFTSAVIGEEPCKSLPGKTASDDEILDSAAPMLLRHGATDGDFFDRLVHERPRRAAEIQRVRALWVPAPASSDRPRSRSESKGWPFFGRAAEIDALRTALLSTNPPQVALLGQPGVGKSVLARKVLEDEQVKARFSHRRWLVRLNGAHSRQAAVNAIAAELRLRWSAVPEDDLYDYLEMKPGVLVLADVSEPLEADRCGMEDLLERLSEIAHLVLVVTHRYRVPPDALRDAKVIDVPCLTPDEAHALFLRFAPKCAGDPRVPALLAPLGQHPLAIAILATISRTTDLDNVAREWRDRGGDILARIFKVAWDGGQMTPAVRRLASVLALFPAGAIVEDYDHWMAGAAEAARILDQATLGVFESGRLRLHPAVAHYVKAVHALDAGDLDRACARYAALVAKEGPRVGRSPGGRSAARLAAELPNIKIAVERGLASGDPGPWIDVVRGLTRLARFTGRDEPSLLPEAQRVAEASNDAVRLAGCKLDDATIKLARSNYSDARLAFDDALDIYRRLDRRVEQARCIEGLGDVALARCAYDVAQKHYEDARELYCREQHRLGQAQAALTLGEAALRRGLLDEAEREYRAAQEHYKLEGSAIGQAGCLRGLAEVALRRGNVQDANTQCCEALVLFETHDVRAGRAGCLWVLGEIALRESRYPNAGAHYKKALALFKDVHNVRGQATCLKGQGDVKVKQSRYEPAAKLYAEALALYRKVGDHASAENCARLLNDVASGPPASRSTR